MATCFKLNSAEFFEFGYANYQWQVLRDVAARVFEFPVVKNGKNFS